jgi:hypothetical protein
MTVDIYHVMGNSHMADAVFAYIPEHKIAIEGDLGTATDDLNWWGESWFDNMAYRKLDVEKNVPVHLTVMTTDELRKMTRESMARVRKLCADRLAHGEYLTGCEAVPRLR